MKSLQILACSIAFLIPAVVNAVPATPAPGQLQQLLTEGQTAFMRGDTATAKTDFDWVLGLDPHNKTAIGYLRRIILQEGHENKGVALEKRLDTVMIPKLEFKQANLGAALDYMKRAASKLTRGRVNVSFVMQVPPAKVNSPVTLSLSNVPFTEALRYIGGLTDLTFTYDKYAIVVRPTANATAPTAPGAVVPVPGAVPGR